ncbi:hypothetical protein DTO166G4_3994 [Paecilomyces variotii]|nr:hypothetical protein DTO164E3_6477 [Paecilomyces variotii]KAJ9197610.1 hypothetical protein DTO032I3_5833 [Paecilomyces variotii]KAJ9214370.1 hypothetical protein DTO166G4_3994 [Paecilomyces variotii]KAJ9232143.1 hypothetical protein DTO169E5_7614 [Paecilomyces variotii]KAJ9234865.1 hypothetical protein DTO166G5_4950 [Paecilomyces variotii]
MPPRLRLARSRISQSLCRQRVYQYEVLVPSRFASGAAASAVTPAASIEQMTTSYPPIARYPPSQPPSHRRPEERRSQLLRQYTSLLRTAPLMVLFQHNNLQSTEWAGIRRELSKALQKVDDDQAAAGRSLPPLASSIKLQIIQNSIFETALRIVEYYHPDQTALKAGKPTVSGSKNDPALTHDLSRAAHDAVMNMKGKHELTTLLSGPLAVLSFPHVSPEHLKAALSILAPKATGFPAPTRRANPGYYELTVQDGLQKLMLLAARVDGKVFDVDETKWVGSIEGGMDGLRSQLVTMLQSIGAGITNALDGHSKSLYLTLESRRSVLEDEQKGEGKSEP